jgi:hypothetical protein
MTFMLCRNRVADFARWKAVFASDAKAHLEAGLRLVNIWRSAEEPNNIFFLFEVADADKAKQFLDHPHSAEAGVAAGVIDGEFHFIEDAGGY